MCLFFALGFPGGAVVKNPPAKAGDTRDVGLISGSGRSPGVGSSRPLQYSCLENPIDRSLAGYSPWGHKESDTTEQLSTIYFKNGIWYSNEMNYHHMQEHG